MPKKTANVIKVRVYSLNFSLQATETLSSSRDAL